MAWRGEGSSSARGSGSMGQRGDAWSGGTVGGGRGRPSSAAGSANCAGGQRKQEGREEEEEARLLCKFRKDKGSHCKTKISPKLGLK